MNRKFTPEELEQFIHQQLRGLPPRRAPRSLEARVRAALEQQAAVPWYHKSWSYWPGAVKTAFLVFATTFGAAAIGGFLLLWQGADRAAFLSTVSEKFAGIAAVYRVLAWIANLGSELAAGIPSLWLYGGAAFLALMYGAFFGLGAAAYRVIQRSN